MLFMTYCALTVKLHKFPDQSPLGLHRQHQKSTNPKEAKWAEEYIYTSRRQISAWKSMDLEACVAWSIISHKSRSVEY